MARALALLAVLAGAAFGCSKENAAESGTGRDAEAIDAAVPTDADAPDAAPHSGPCRPPAILAGGACLTPAVDPGRPTFPATVGTLTVVARTASTSPSDGTDAPVELCLDAARCFELDLEDDLDERLPGAIDVHHFEDVALPRAGVDRVELAFTTAAPLDDWTPQCVSILFDGELVYCKDGGLPHLGSTAANTRWRDPATLHTECASCWPTPLTHGPMLGGLDPDRARIFVRTDATRAVSLRLSGSATTANPPAVAWLYPRPDRDFTGILEVGGLEPGRTYYYGIDVDGLSRAAPRALHMPPPAGAPGRFALAYGSCTGRTTQPVILDHLRALEPELFLFIGDNHYGNTTRLSVHRHYYRQALEMPSRAAFVAEIPILATWDDHDFLGNNSWGMPRFRGFARRAFLEYWPNPEFGSAGEGVYFKYSRGDVDIFMLDARYFRDQPTGPIVYGDAAGRRSMLGGAQTTWLLDQLAASTATFKLIVNGSVWTEQGGADSWASFLPAREAIFDAIRDRGVEGVVLLTGDAHHAQFRSIARTSSGAYDLPELISSALAHNSSVCPEPHPEIITCTDGQMYAIHLAIDTMLPDPTLTATIYELHRTTGAFSAVAAWTIARSELDL